MAGPWKCGKEQVVNKKLKPKEGVFDLMTGMGPGGMPNCPFPSSVQMKLNALIDELYGLGVIPTKLLLDGECKGKYCYSYPTGYSKVVAKDGERDLDWFDMSIEPDPVSREFPPFPSRYAKRSDESEQES